MVPIGSHIQESFALLNILIGILLQAALSLLLRLEQHLMLMHELDIRYEFFGRGGG